MSYLFTFLAVFGWLCAVVVLVVLLSEAIGWCSRRILLWDQFGFISREVADACMDVSALKNKCDTLEKRVVALEARVLMPAEMVFPEPR